MEDIKDKRQDHTRSTDAGILNKVRGGLDELKTKLDKDNKEGGNLPGNELCFAALRTFKSQGKGHFNRKRTGTEQTNRNGIIFFVKLQ